MDAFEREVAAQARLRAQGLRGMGFLAAAGELDAMALDLEAAESQPVPVADAESALVSDTAA